jgi:hypothetical protein
MRRRRRYAVEYRESDSDEWQEFECCDDPEDAKAICNNATTLSAFRGCELQVMGYKANKRPLLKRKARTCARVPPRP